jgi:hypothetical protein
LAWSFRRASKKAAKPKRLPSPSACSSTAATPCSSSWG